MHRAAGVGIEDLVDRIERRPAPIDAAAGEWKQQGALRRRRRVETVVAPVGELRFASRATEPRKQIEGVVDGNPLRH
jgi:hypothetical protein